MILKFKYLKLFRIHILCVILVFLSSFEMTAKVEAAAVANTTGFNITMDGVTQRYVAAPIRLIVNGVEMNNLDMPPIILDGVTLVPAADVLRMLGAVVTWNGNYKELLIGLKDKLMVLQINNPRANINGAEFQMSQPPKIINDKTMIPIRFVSEAFGMIVTWHEASRSINVIDATQNTQTFIPTIPTQTVEPTQTPQFPVSPPSSTPNNNINVSDNTLPTPIYGATELPDSFKAEQAKDISSSVITAMDFPTTKITQILTPGANENIFTIVASSQISSVNKFILPDNRIVIDINNSEVALPQATIELSNPNITRIRAAQNQITPTKITRIVFDVKVASDFSVSISQDRKNIYVSFQKNAVNDISFRSEGNADLITLSMQNRSAVNVFPMTNPQRIVIDVPFSEMRKMVDTKVTGVFVTGIRSSQFEESTGRIVLDLSASAQYSVIEQDNIITIKISESTYRNIVYDLNSHTLKIYKGNYPIDIKAIKLRDEYQDLRYILTLPGNYQHMIGYGEYIIKDDYLRSILIQNDSTGMSEIVLFEMQVLALNISEDAEYIYIRLIKPKEKYPRIVMLDPGHGGHDNGASGFGMHEKNLNLDIVKRIVPLIEAEGSVKVYTMRDTDIYIAPEERPEFANPIADLFISVHINSVENGDPKPNGTETYYYPHSNDTTIGFTGKQTADIIQKNLIAALGSTDRKSKQYSYVVVSRTTMPSALAEIGFITNPDEAAKLGTESYRQKAATAIFQSIIEIFSKYKPMR